jgi:hypothetical protein
VAKNYNLIWANPITFIIGVMLFNKTIPKWITYLLFANATVLAIFIPVSFFITQVIPIAAYPLIGILVIRSWILWKKTKNNQPAT